MLICDCELSFPKADHSKFTFHANKMTDETYDKFTKFTNQLAKSKNTIFSRSQSKHQNPATVRHHPLGTTLVFHSVTGLCAVVKIAASNN